MPGLRLDHLADAQKLTPEPYGSARPCRHQISSGISLDPLEELGHEARLADPGTPTSVTSCGSRSPHGAVERVEDGAELALAADERRHDALLEIHPESRLRLHRFPDVDRLRLALRRDRLVLRVLDAVARRTPCRLAGEECRSRAPPTASGPSC
jgi:hypothetical protein